jgi:hypothetical protein
LLVSFLGLFSYVLVERDYEKARIQQLENDLKSAQMNCDLRNQAYEKMLLEEQQHAQYLTFLHSVGIRIYELERHHSATAKIIASERLIGR